MLYFTYGNVNRVLQARKDFSMNNTTIGLIAFVDAIHEKTGLPKKTIKEVLDASIGYTIDAVKDNQKIQFMGFGSFKLRHVDEHKARHPQTGKSITVPAHDVLAFSSKVKY